MYAHNNRPAGTGLPNSGEYLPHCIRGNRWFLPYRWLNEVGTCCSGYIRCKEAYALLTISENTGMKKRNIIAAAAVATAGIASYLIRKNLRSRKEAGDHSSADAGRHVRNVVAKAKSGSK